MRYVNLCFLAYFALDF